MLKSKYLNRAMKEHSVAYEGSPERLVNLMKRAESGEKLTLCFLGGSITQGSLSSTPERCYAYLVYSWFKKTFAKAEFTYVNAGIGGTTSQFGVARLSENVMPYKPDFCMTEFSVNDGSNEYYRESYEGMLRRIYYSKTKPAMLIMNNLFYDTGDNSQEEHNLVGEAYDITCISVRDAVRPEIESGAITRTDISPDGLHPNDSGHEILAELVTDYLEGLLKTYVRVKGAGKDIPEPAAPVLTNGPVTVNALEHLRRIQYRSKTVECHGFKADYRIKKGIRDIFKHGWKADTAGDSIIYRFVGSELAVQYRKTINRPAPVAIAIIDGDETNPVILDANFEENWGDHIHIDTLLYHGKRINPQAVHHGKARGRKPSTKEAELEAEVNAISQMSPVIAEHTVEIRIIETHSDDRTPFYLVSFISK